VENDLTIEKLRIVEQLQQISTNQAVMGQKIDELAGHYKMFQETLTGTSENPGIIIRVDRLEQKSEGHRWMVRLIWTALIPLALSHLWRVFVTGK